MTATTTTPSEPPDRHVYRWVMFDRGTVESLLAAIRFYEARLDEDINAVQSDPELAPLLDQATIESYPVGQELQRARRARQSLEHHLGRAQRAPFVDISLAHGDIRFLKSVELLY